MQAAARGRPISRYARASGRAGRRPRGADVVSFELWQLGYTSLNAKPARRAEWLAHATTVDGPFVSRFRALARELGLAVVMTYL